MMTDEKYEGRIVKALAGFYYVKRTTDGVVYACRAKGIFRKRNHSPLVGDMAEFVITHEGDKEGNIEKLFPRSSVLTRPTVANVDLGLLVFALKDPAPNERLLDRMLCVLEQAGLSIVICLNKLDLATESAAKRLGDIYERIGYRVIYACTKTGEGKDELLAALSGHLATMVGPSGAGKSSLTNLLSDRPSMEVGAISDKIRRGKQTTRHVELVELLAEKPTFIVDTPGFSSLDFAGLKKEELAGCFPEIHERLGSCKYTSCSHIHEPVADCCVRQAVEAGEIENERYESYRQFYEELAEAERY